MWPYNYLRGDSLFALQSCKGTAHWLCHDVTFHSAFPNRYQKDGLARGEYYLPCSGTRFPFVILLHGLGGGGEKDVVPCRIMARDLAKAGVAAFVLQFEMPFEEVEDADGNKRSLPLIDNWLEVYRMLVINARQVIDWAEDRDELDERRVAVDGISMGGIASSIAMAVDRRVAAGVFLVSGGNMEVISWGSKDDLSRKAHGCTRAQCREVYARYPQYLSDVREKGLENVIPAKECFLFDPLTFAPHLRGRPMLMLNAEHDDFVPGESVLEMWEACGRPRLVWLDAGHNTVFLRHNAIRREVIAFLGEAFGLEGAEA